MIALRSWGGLAIGVAVVFAGADQAAADHGKPSAISTRIEALPMAPAEVMGVRVPGEYVLSVRLDMDEGGALAYRRVRFYEQVELFGPRDAELGESETDSGGIAAIKYRPAVPGERQILVRYEGDGVHAESGYAFVVDVPDVVPAYVRQERPFEALQPWLPIGVALAVSSMWLVLVVTFVRTVLDVRRGAPQA